MNLPLPRSVIHSLSGWTQTFARLPQTRVLELANVLGASRVPVSNFGLGPRSSVFGLRRSLASLSLGLALVLGIASAASSEPARPEAFPAMRPLWDRAPGWSSPPSGSEEQAYRLAEQNARAAAESFYRCRRFVEGWLAHADPGSGLIPRNLNADKDLWNGRDAAADNYPFMVLTCALTDRALFEGRMRAMLEAEIRLTSRLDRLGDHYRFSRQDFAHPQVDFERLAFDNAEYVKDGLVPITEWLGPSPWSERAIGLLEDLWKHASIATPFGPIPTRNFEVNGDLLQACSRFYWFTRDPRFLDWAVRLGDYYLLGNQHPTRDLDQLRLLDHGCEVVNGLSELYVAVRYARPDKRQAYAQPLREIFDAILRQGSNPHGLLYSWFKPKTGEHSPGLCDTWGYVYDGFYTLFLIDGVKSYRHAVRHALSNLRPPYVGACWDDKSADGFADSIEGALNLLNREPVEGVAEWIDSQTRLMWAKQQPDGVIEGWHGDGNIARTSLMYALWKTEGLHVDPWREDVRIGAVRQGGHLFISLLADQPWSGRVVFDTARHRTAFRLPLDYPRINQFPEWFTAKPEHTYRLRTGEAGSTRRLKGQALLDGVPVRLEGGQEQRWSLR